MLPSERSSGVEARGAPDDQDAADELRSLRRQVADLQLENDILKKPHSSSEPSPSPSPQNDRYHSPANRHHHPAHLQSPEFATEFLLNPKLVNALLTVEPVRLR